MRAFQLLLPLPSVKTTALCRDCYHVLTKQSTFYRLHINRPYFLGAHQGDKYQQKKKFRSKCLKNNSNNNNNNNNYLLETKTISDPAQFICEKLVPLNGQTNFFQVLSCPPYVEPWGSAHVYGDPSLLLILVCLN